MASLLDTLVGGYASLFCLNERRGSPQMSAKVHAPLERRSAPLQKKPTKLSINDRLRALIGDIISEEELEQRLSFGRVLGAGATSKVYEAVEMSSGQRVSVKVFDKVSMVEARRSMVADGQYVREKAVHRVRRRLLKLVSELEISKSLDHPNIIKYLAPTRRHTAFVSFMNLIAQERASDRPTHASTATDLLSYGWFQDSPKSESLSDNQEEDWLCTKRKTELNDDIRCRSLSCRRTTESDGTYSSSASLEDVSKRKLSSPTHFSSLEKEAVEGTTF
ncbi:hypothetical protein AM588_10010599 [Phytophthora nicotianae]|uniref:Protein kinase domain-containing protein n=1 Tax=Phytophthora nicotianae TaxID=4792 RepID=A0A0W8DI46_PHYNI|nr:hypothetical protein AM588_10010599 [Phytophthora nicotianae]